MPIHSIHIHSVTPPVCMTLSTDEKRGKEAARERYVPLLNRISTNTPIMWVLQTTYHRLAPICTLNID